MQELGGTDPIFFALVYLNDITFFFATISQLLKSVNLYPYNHNRYIKNDACLLVVDVLIGVISAQLLYTDRLTRWMNMTDDRFWLYIVI